MNFPPGTSQSLGGGGGPSASHLKSLLEQHIPSIFVLIITNPPKEPAELLPGAGPPQGSRIWSIIVAGSRDAESCGWCPGCTGWDEASDEHWAAGYQQWDEFPFLRGERKKSKREQELLFPLPDVSFLAAPGSQLCLHTGLSPALGHFSILGFARQKVRKEEAAASKKERKQGVNSRVSQRRVFSRRALRFKDLKA